MAVQQSIGTSVVRHESQAKVTGRAPYAYEHPCDQPLYLALVRSTVCRGEVDSIDASVALAQAGVVAVLTHENAPRLSSDSPGGELDVLQNSSINYRGQIVAAVIADSSERARMAAELVVVDENGTAFDTTLRVTNPTLYKPDTVAPRSEPDSVVGEPDRAPGADDVALDNVYATPTAFHNPMEPHATIARYADGVLTLHEGSQGVSVLRSSLAAQLGLDESAVHVISPYVGGGFGSKAEPHAPCMVAALAAMHLPGRTVKLALTRREMFALVGCRSPTLQRVRLTATAEGRLLTINHESVAQTATFKEFAEPAAVLSRVMYSAADRRTTHRLVRLDVPAGTYMRAPGEGPGSFATEVALDELAHRCGLDPVELRLRNEPPRHPESGLPWSSRRLQECLHEGAERFGWRPRVGRSAPARDGDWLVGTGMAAGTYPANQMPGSAASIEYCGGRYSVAIASADMGQGAWTILGQIAADALEVPLAQVELTIGDSALPSASMAVGSSGTASWGTAITNAAAAFRAEHGAEPRDGAQTTADAPEDQDASKYARHAFGAQFAEVHVHADTGEIRAARLLGVFDVGRVINPRLAHSQLIGGMTMGLGMALHEQGVQDPQFGHTVNADLASYHVPAHADVLDLQAYWLDGFDAHVSSMGAKGMGEIGVVGLAAAVANAVHDATGVRVRELPITIDKVLSGLPPQTAVN